MEPWQHSLKNSLTDPAILAARFGLDPAPLARVAARYPLRITPHYLGLLQGPGDPLWRQCVPDPRELDPMGLLDDPLAEAAHAPLPAVVHRYPDRVLLLAGTTCALYCRFCTRKRKVGCAGEQLSFGALLDGLGYIERTPQVRDVLISGGDPLLLPDSLLAEVLGRLSTIPHVEMIRIGSRVPVTLPERITAELCKACCAVTIPSISTPTSTIPGRSPPRRPRPAGASPTPACRSATRRCSSRGSTMTRRP